jgi:hypothetical protein
LTFAASGAHDEYFLAAECAGSDGEYPCWFLSIDCGSTQNYTENNIAWVADEGSYMNLGSTIEQPSVDYFCLGNNDPIYCYGYKQPLLTYRHFPAPGYPEARNKYCFPLTVQNSSAPHLVRVGFYMNTSLFEAARPFEFIVFVNAAQWFTITSGSVSARHDLLEFEEGIFQPTGSTSLNICLQPVVGQAFISSLELRQLDDNMYSYAGGAVQYLSMKERWNFEPGVGPLVR